MSTNVSNSKKQKDHSELVDEKVEVSTVSESDVAASKEEDPFHTAVESITSSPVTSEKEAEEYVSNQTFAAANEHEMQALISILEGEAPADRKAILKALVQREKLKEGASKKCSEILLILYSMYRRIADLSLSSCLIHSSISCQGS